MILELGIGMLLLGGGSGFAAFLGGCFSSTQTQNGTQHIHRVVQTRSPDGTIVTETDDTDNNSSTTTESGDKRVLEELAASPEAAIHAVAGVLGAKVGLSGAASPVQPATSPALSPPQVLGRQDSEGALMHEAEQAARDGDTELFQADKQEIEAKLARLKALAAHHSPPSATHPDSQHVADSASPSPVVVGGDTSQVVHES